MSRTKTIACSFLGGLLLLVIGGFAIDCGYAYGGGAIMFTGGFFLFAAWAYAQEPKA